MLKIFLCHSSGDKEEVRRLRTQLLSAGFQPWLDEEDILPGQDWDREIRRAIRASDLVLVCLSRASVTKTGYVQKEIRIVLDEADHQPEGTIYVIPARLEDCEVPERLQRWHRVDLFKQDGYGRLLRSLAAVGRSPVTEQGVRYDGLYAQVTEQYTQLLRFYADRSVLSTTTTGRGPEIARWFTKENPMPYFGKGTYEISGNLIKFTTKIDIGTIEYEGTLHEDGTELHLHTHSRINGHQSDGVWRFLPVNLYPSP
ncbi:toll/interleukin-1 receptor domain-containing protein [Streptomyces sp. NPDC057280]|uniref:toll/interleukin-1 receptor domain-containing protein n=1 Tax=Streptomyces sp. NPDC057280 TaxID=3346081 RepID=UPI00362589F9